jgi:hypothetical protein
MPLPSSGTVPFSSPNKFTRDDRPHENLTSSARILSAHGSQGLAGVCRPISVGQDFSVILAFLEEELFRRRNHKLDGSV